MISWRLCLAFAVIFYTNSATPTSCSDDYQCREKCCNGVCHSSCPSSDSTSKGPISDIVVIIIVIVVAVAKIIFWVFCCYCWQERRNRAIVFRRFDTGGDTVIVQQATTEMTPTTSQGYITSPEGNNPVQQGYFYQHNQNDINTNPANNTPLPFTKDRPS